MYKVRLENKQYIKYILHKELNQAQKDYDTRKELEEHQTIELIHDSEGTEVQSNPSDDHSS